MQLASVQMTKSLFHISFLLVAIFQDYTNVEAVKHKNVTSNSTTSPWLRKTVNSRATGCRYRPWICNQDSFRSRSLKICCRNRCVDVSYDVNNCGFCGIRCPFTLQCCQGMCVNTNTNPFNCGGCNKICQFPSLCLYGLCGYSQQFPPFPFPLPPFPFPPFPIPPAEPLPRHNRPPPCPPPPPIGSGGSHLPSRNQPPPSPPPHSPRITTKKL